MARRYFEFVEGTSSKFWEVWIEKNEVRTRYGKIGSAGQTTVKDEGSADAANKLHDKLVKEKTGKGYAEKAAGAVVGPPNERVTAPMEPMAKPKKAAAAAPAPSVPKEEAPRPDDGFRRWENTEDGAAKFWEIKVEESTHTVRFGKLGTAGQEKTKDFEDEGEAENDADALIAEKTKKGYRPVGKHGPDLGPTNPELEAAIGKNLDDPSGYLVYADWLSSQGEARGELIVLHHQAFEAKDEAKKKELTKAANALIKKHKERLLGPLASFEEGEKKLELDWHLGFIRGAKMSWEMWDDGGGEDARAKKALAALIALPAAKFVRALRFGPFPGEEESNFQPLVEALEANPPPHLEELILGDLGDWDISMTNTGAAGDAIAKLTTLKRLTLRAGQIGFASNLSMPALRELSIETGGLTLNNIKQIISLKAPNLERLSIWFGDENYGASGALKDVMPILNGTQFPKLKHLGIMNCTFVNEVVAALPKSKILKQLESLDLSMGCLSDASIDAMLASNAFGHLQLLELTENALTEASEKKVGRLAKKVNFGDEHEPERATPDAYRYCSVGE